MLISRASFSRGHGFLRSSRSLTGTEPSLEDLDTCIPLLQGCQSLSDGECLHVHIATNGYDTFQYMQNMLLHMYSKFGSLNQTCQFFSKMEPPEIFPWNIIINSFAQNGHIAVAFHIFEQLWDYLVIPNQFTFVSILSVCRSALHLPIGEHMHMCIVMCGLENDVVVDTAIVNMYSKCGDLRAATMMFYNMLTPNVYSWSAVIAAYAQHGQGEEAVCLFHLMQDRGQLPNNVTFISLLDACACVGDLDLGTKVHSSVVGTEIECDTTVATAFVNLYAKCNHLKAARKVFDNLSGPNVISWNAMISAYAQHGEGKEALKLFNKMKRKGFEPNKASFVAVLDACTGIRDLKEGEWVHAQMSSYHFEPDIVLLTALVNMYGKCGCLVKACEVFESMPHKNMVTWNAIIAGYSLYGHSKEAFKYFRQMQSEGVIPERVTFVSMFGACAKLLDLRNGKYLHAWIVVTGSEFDITVATAIINMYGKCDEIEDARSLFEDLPEKNSITWSSMIGAYAQRGQGDDVFCLYNRMHGQNVRPDMVTCITVLDMCASMAALAQGEKVHCEAVMESYESDEAVGTSLVSLYGRCGSLESASAVFIRMSPQTVVPWNALFASCAQHGQGKETLELFNKMQDAGVLPNEVTFISVLNACSHAGLVKEGWNCFYLMSQDYGIAASSDHYGCMVDLFGRAGLLNEAEGLIYDMPERPTSVTWMSLLGACRHQRDVERGERAASILSRLDPKNAASQIILSRLYAASVIEDGKVFTVEEETSQIHITGCSMEAL